MLNSCVIPLLCNTIVVGPSSCCKLRLDACSKQKTLLVWSIALHHPSDCHLSTIDATDMDATKLPDDIRTLLLQKAADHAFHAITITRAAHAGQPGEIVYVNDAFTELTGHSAEAVIGETPGVLQGPKTEQEVLDRLGRKLDAGQVFHGQTVNYRNDGSEFMMEWKVIPVERKKSANYYVAVQREATA